MASAIYVPNVEFVFGIIGATTAVVISYVMPALIFLKLMDASPDLWKSNKGSTLIPPETKAVWNQRRLLAIALLCFGIMAGIVCTNAVLIAVKVG